MRKIGWVWLLALPGMVLAQRVSWTNYTTNQTLPANVTYGVIQSRDGHIWVATEEGLCFFNGYEFVRPVDTSFWNGAEAFMPVEDPQGRIWFARIDGSLWYVLRDTVRPFPYQNRIEPFCRRYQLPQDIQTDADGSLWLAYNTLGFVHIYPDGSFQVVQSSSGGAFAYAEVNGRITAVVVIAPPEQLPSSLASSIAICRNHHLEYSNALPARPGVHPPWRGFWKLRNGDILHAYKGTYYLLRADSVVWQVRLGYHANHAVQTAEGALLLTVPTNPTPGLYYFASIEDLKRNRGLNLLPGHFVTDIAVDSQGGWWATTHHAGLFYCKNPKLEVFDRSHGLPSDEITSLSYDGGKRLFVGFRPAAIVAVHVENLQITPLPVPPLSSRDVEALLFEPQQQRLWCASPLYYYQGGRHWQPAHLFGMSSLVGSKSISLGPRSGRLWCASSRGLFEVDTRRGWAYHHGQMGEAQLYYSRTFDVVESATGDVWVTNREGLRLWRRGDGQRLPGKSREKKDVSLRFQARSLCVIFDGLLAIGLRNGGVLIRHPNGHTTHLTQANGLVSAFTTRLRTGAGKAFYVCSSNGLSRLELLPEGDWSVRVLTHRAGLPSQQVSDVLEAGGYLWIATNKGLVRLRDMPPLAQMPSPQIKRLLVNNTPLPIPPLGLFPHDANTLLLQFHSLHYPSEGRITYRYRLLGVLDSSFTVSTNREVLLANLAPGRYTFEVQAQDDAGTWSLPTRWSFRIRPPWWQTIGFWTLLGLATVLILTLGYRWRLRQIQQQMAVREKIRQLEISALRAQINPHFIFNCLSSIQHFIAENDSASATYYLACFARLVRLALHSSVDGRHALSEEVEMLHSYLSLEQLRFQKRFDFRILVDPTLSADDILLPPLLVQPFVENALLHGLHNKTDGLVEVAFTLDGAFLVVAVTDNGPGVREANASRHAYKSLGMMLTQRRLAMLSEETDLDARRENLTHSDGSVAGLRVTIRIPLSHKAEP